MGLNATHPLYTPAKLKQRFQTIGTNTDPKMDIIAQKTAKYLKPGSLVAKLDGTPTEAYTLAGNIITFTTAPGSGVVITADYRYTCAITVDGIHKTSTRVIDLTFTIQFGEPT